MKIYKINNNQEVEVSDKIYSAICYMSYKVRRARAKDKKYNLFFIYAFDTEDSDGENPIRDNSPLADEIVITNDIYKALYDALATLSTEDQLLLVDLFIKEQSIRSIAESKHCSPMAICRHRDKLFKNLAILLKKYKDNIIIEN